MIILYPTMDCELTCAKFFPIARETVSLYTVYILKQFFHFYFGVLERQGAPFFVYLTLIYHLKF